MFSGATVDAFAAILSVSVGLGMIIVWREIKHQQLAVLYRHEISALKAQVAALQEVILRHFPGEQVALHIDGNVNGSTIETAGRDARS